jgi:hypothetical protein
MADTTQDFDFINFDGHSLATAVTVPTASQFGGEVVNDDRQPLGEPFDDRDQTRSM